MTSSFRDLLDYYANVMEGNSARLTKSGFGQGATLDKQS